MSGGYVQINETPIRYLAPGEGKTRQGYLWSCHRPGVDGVFHWQTSRAAACLEKIVPVDFARLPSATTAQIKELTPYAWQKRHSRRTASAA